MSRSAHRALGAFHLPALPHAAATPWTYGKGDAQVQLRLPQLTPALLAEQVDAMLSARDLYLATRPVAQIVAPIGRVAERFLDPADELRRVAEAALPPVTGLSAPMARRVLDGMAAEWRSPALRGLLRAEFGDPEVLDHFRPRGRAWGRTRALGPRLATHFFSGTVPGVAVGSLIRSLLLKAATLGRTAVGDPLLPVLFAQALAQEDAELGECLAVAYWPGGNEPLDRIALDAADAVLVHGGREAVEAARARASREARVFGHADRVSFGVLARESLTAARAAELAQRAAMDVAMFDQRRCASPHTFYVEEGGEVTPAEWASRLAGAMAEMERDLPRGAPSRGEAADIRQLRAEAELAQLAGQGVELHASAEGTAWTVIYDPDPAFRTSCRNRTVRVQPITELDEIPRLLRDSAPSLQCVGVAGPEPRLSPIADALARLGVSRLAPLGGMAWPPPTWHADGHPPLRGLVRWCDWEE